MKIKSILYLILLLISSFGLYQATQTQTSLPIALISSIGVMIFFVLFILSLVTKTISTTNGQNGQTIHRVTRNDLYEK